MQYFCLQKCWYDHMSILTLLFPSSQINKNTLMLHFLLFMAFASQRKRLWRGKYPKNTKMYMYFSHLIKSRYIQKRIKRKSCPKSHQNYVTDWWKSSWQCRRTTHQAAHQFSVSQSPNHQIHLHSQPIRISLIQLSKKCTTI